MDFLARHGIASRVVLTTSKWDAVEADPTPSAAANANDREDEFITSSWKDIINRGARTRRFLNTHSSAREVVNIVLQRDPLEFGVIQNELRTQGTKKPDKTRPKRGCFSSVFRFFGARCVFIYADGNLTDIRLRTQKHVSLVSPRPRNTSPSQARLTSASLTQLESLWIVVSPPKGPPLRSRLKSVLKVLSVTVFLIYIRSSFPFIPYLHSSLFAAPAITLYGPSPRAMKTQCCPTLLNPSLIIYSMRLLDHDSLLN